MREVEALGLVEVGHGGRSGSPRRRVTVGIPMAVMIVVFAMVAMAATRDDWTVRGENNGAAGDEANRETDGGRSRIGNRAR